MDGRNNLLAKKRNIHYSVVPWRNSLEDMIDINIFVFV